MLVTVMGAGNGGLAIAFEWAQQGHTVRLYSHPDFAGGLSGVKQRGGIGAEGVLDGFAPIAVATTDAEEALDGAELIFVVSPAYATEAIASVARPHLRDGMTVVVCPGSCVGSLAFKRAAGLGLTDESILVGETSTLPYAVRATDAGSVHIFHRFDTGLFAAAAPRAGTPRLLDALRQVWPATEAATTVFQTTLQNGNPVIHPAVTILNAALIERTHGDFKFYEEGVTRASGRVIEAVDTERLAIASALGVSVLSEPETGVRQGYMTEVNYSTGYSKAPGFIGIRAQRQLEDRYLTEDVGYSMVFLTDLAQTLQVPTPTMDALVRIASVILGRDFRAEGARTMAGMGLADLTREALLAY